MSWLPQTALPRPAGLGRIDIQCSQIMEAAKWTKPVTWMVRRSWQVAKRRSGEVLELAEAPLDAVAVLIGGSVVWDGDLAASVRGNRRLGPHSGDHGA